MYVRVARDGVVSLAASILGRLRRRDALLVLALIALFLLSLPAWGPLASPGYPKTHHYPIVEVLQFETDKCFQDGQFPCRWAPGLQQGYGSPALMSWPPLPSYVGELIHLGGVGFLDTVKVLYIIGFVLSALFMFLLAREFWGNLGGLVAGVFYVYAPFHAVSVYVRGDLPEHWALAFMPAILWGIYKVIKEGKPVYVLLLALFLSAILLSREVLVMMLFPLAMVWAAAFLLTTRQWLRVTHLAIAGGAGLSLAAFFTLPELLEQDLTYIKDLKTIFPFSDHFPTMEQLFLSRFWGYGISLPGDGDGLSFQIGWLHWGLAAVSILIAPLLWRRSRAGFVAVVVGFAFFWGSVFVMHPRSDFLWQAFNGLLQYQQTPYRFLALAILTSSFLAGAIVLVANRRPYLSLLLSIALIGAVIGANQGFFHFGERLSVDFAGAASAGQYHSARGGWLSAYATEAPTEPAPAKVQLILGDADITDVRQGSASLAFAAESVAGARLRTSVMDFPHWRVRVDGKTVLHDRNNSLAAISFDLPPGSHQVKLSLEDTALRTFSDYLSLAAWALFLVSAGALAGRAAWSTLRRRRAAPDRRKLVIDDYDAQGYRRGT